MLFCDLSLLLLNTWEAEKELLDEDGPISGVPLSAGD